MNSRSYRLVSKFCSTRKLVEQNLLTKRYEREFLGDIYAILRPGVDYNQDAAFEWILDELVPLLE